MDSDQLLLNIQWSARAKKDYEAILDFILLSWSQKEVKKFDAKTQNVLSLLSKNPNLFPVSKKKKIHKCVLTKQTSLFYKVSEKEIFLITFWDNRKDPKNLAL